MVGAVVYCVVDQMEVNARVDLGWNQDVTIHVVEIGHTELADPTLDLLVEWRVRGMVWVSWRNRPFGMTHLPNSLVLDQTRQQLLNRYREWSGQPWVADGRRCLILQPVSLAIPASHW